MKTFLTINLEFKSCISPKIVKVISIKFVNKIGINYSYSAISVVSIVLHRTVKVLVYMYMFEFVDKNVKRNHFNRG